MFVSSKLYSQKENFMKIAQLLVWFIFTYSFFSIKVSNAQQNRELQPLESDDFECLQSIECIQDSRSLKDKGWLFVFDETVDEFQRELTASMKGENISLIAIYDEYGYLIRSEYKRKNVALPASLLSHLFEGSYKGWQLNGTELVMKNFDPATIKYKVVLENSTSTKSEVYDFEFISELNSEYEELTKQ